MDIYEYDQLPLGERARLLWKKATHLERYTDSDHTSNLYHLHNFFIEAIVSHKKNHIVEVRPFKKGSRLEKYLVQVSLAAII